MSKILLIDNYDSFTYNLYHYVSSFNKNVDVKRNDKVNSKDIIKNKYKKIIISPGPGNPDDEKVHGNYRGPTLTYGNLIQFQMLRHEWNLSAKQAP